MSENLHKRRSSMRTRGFGVDVCQKLIDKLNALENGKEVMETVPNPEAASRALIRKPMKRRKD